MSKRHERRGITFQRLRMMCGWDIRNVMCGKPPVSEQGRYCLMANCPIWAKLERQEEAEA